MNLIIHYPASMKTGRIDRHSVKVRPIIQAKHEQNRRCNWYPTNIGFADDQLFPGSIGISPPYLGHSSFLRQAQIQPFKYVTTAFSACQGIDHLVSGQILVVKRAQNDAFCMILAWFTPTSQRLKPNYLYWLVDPLYQRYAVQIGLTLDRCY